MKCISPYYHPTLGILCPCRQCLPCRINRRRDWSIRAILEMTDFETATFLTLTYDDDNIPLNGSLVSKDLTNFWKRLRKRGLKFRYFACGEYGENTYRPHYHAIIYGLDSVTVGFFASECWKYGFNYSVPATIETIKYVAGYVTKKVAVNKEMRDIGLDLEFVRSSQGLGRSALTKLLPLALSQNNGLDVLSNIKIGGVTFSLPNFIKRKLREMVFDLEYQQKLKDARIFNMQEEVVKVINKHFGTSENVKDLALLGNSLDTKQAYLNLLSKDKIWNSRSKV